MASKLSEIEDGSRLSSSRARGGGSPNKSFRSPSRENNTPGLTQEHDNNNINSNHGPSDFFNRSFVNDPAEAPQATQANRNSRNMLGAGLNIDTTGLGRSERNEHEIKEDMAKTSMFGGYLNSAQLPTSPKGARLQYQVPGASGFHEDAAADSCFSVKGSSIC